MKGGRPRKQLKNDRPLAEQLGEQVEPKAILRAVITPGARGMRVTAEGIAVVPKVLQTGEARVMQPYASV